MQEKLEQEKIIETLKTNGIAEVDINEGIIDFKDIDWIIHEKNFGIIADLRVFLKDIKENKSNNYHLISDDAKLVDYYIKEKKD